MNVNRDEAPSSLAALMAQAWAMELEATERYEELADVMEMHNNREVALLFRKMAGYEAAHAKEILEEMGWAQSPPRLSGAPPQAPAWHDAEAPETTAYDDVHYLMQPYHALQLALAAEERAERFFARLVETATDGVVRDAARRLQAEEQEHVALVRAWMAKVSPPERDWAVDPDPPRNVE